MDIQQIQDIVNLVANSQLAEMQINVHGDSIRIKNRQQPALLSSEYQSSSIDIANLQTTQVQQPSSSTYLIKSTHIGRLKLAQDAISEPMIKVGDRVQEGDTIAFVACMAQLLPVVADKTGYVSDIFLEDNAKVEYGTPLFQLTL